MIERLVLWDIDGTLLRAGPLAREAFYRAVARTLGRHPGGHRVQMGGKTDPQIVLEILDSAVGAREARLKLPAALTRLEAELADGARSLRAHGRVLPGVVEVLARLDDDPTVHQSVLTGNTAANAFVKLAAFELTPWLDLEVGAYGSDDADRTCLVPVALDRARRLRGVAVEPGQVWVVGDTPSDLACARAGGARCLLVATGRVPWGTLADAGADAVVADLTDVESVRTLLRS
ncbi:MAG: HAD family hydrolase [Acidimicrobiales bacterium]